MKLPDAMREARGGEPITRAVALDGDDILATTPTRTLVYHGEGIISDESVDEFPHDVERFLMSDGRRKTTFTLDYVDTEREVTVPASVTGDVLDALLEGICTAEGVLDGDETVVGTFRFSELTLIVADHQLVKHVGGTVWDQDFETFRYGALTDLAFDQLGGALEVVLEVDGRPQRIKTPGNQARVVEETIKTAVFEYFEVQTMDDLRSFVSPAEEEDDADDDGGLGLDSGIDPLGGTAGSSAFEDPLAEDSAPPDTDAVEDSTGETSPESAPETGRVDRDAPGQDGTDTDADDRSTGDDSSDQSPATGDDSSDQSPATGDDSSDQSPATGGESSDRSSATADRSRANTDRGEAVDSADGIDPDSVGAMVERIDDLTEAIEKQNRLLSKQHQALKQLATEIRDED